MLWRWHFLSLLFVITHKLCTFVPKSDVCTYFNANLADFWETEVSLSCFFALPVGKEVSVGGCSPLRYAPRGCTPQRNILIPLFKICTSILNLGGESLPYFPPFSIISATKENHIVCTSFPLYSRDSKLSILKDIRIT